MKKFKELAEREILALFDGLRHDYVASAAVFDSMRKEESGHRRRLIELSQQKFGEHIPSELFLHPPSVLLRGISDQG